MSCECGLLWCYDQYAGHTCTLEANHSGPHSCHGRMWRTKIRRGDIAWSDNDKTWPPVAKFGPTTSTPEGDTDD